MSGKLKLREIIEALNRFEDEVELDSYKITTSQEVREYLDRDGFKRITSGGEKSYKFYLTFHSHEKVEIPDDIM